MVKRYTRRKHRSKKRGGFRYGNKTRHTPTPGDVLISVLKTKTKTKSKTRSKSRARGKKMLNWF